MSVLSWQQIAALALTAGFPPADAAIATAITEPEAGRNQAIVQAGQPYATTGWGLWQITPGDSVPQFGIDDQMLVGLNNARAAHAKWKGAGGFSPWTTYEHGLEAPFIPVATQAVAAVSGMSLDSLQKLVTSTAAGVDYDADADMSHISLRISNLFRTIDRDLVYVRMTTARIAVPGWTP